MNLEEDPVPMEGWISEKWSDGDYERVNKIDDFY